VSRSLHRAVAVGVFRRVERSSPWPLLPGSRTGGAAPGVEPRPPRPMPPPPLAQSGSLPLGHEQDPFSSVLAVDDAQRQDLVVAFG
jgi:hypothetical protein